MEDGKALHNNLLGLKLPSSSSSSSKPLLIPPPPDADALLDFFNHGAPTVAAFTNPLFNSSPMYDHHYNHHHQHHPCSSSSSSFMGPPEIAPSSFIDPAHALLSSNGVMGGKRRKMGANKGGGMEKPREVIHVRAKRGQATDSHSLAERVRRERINEKLKVLQDLVPGCYKTMGMAVMLDVIINYVRNLQNQIEFLSMKLSAASMFYDFNSPEAEAMETFQRTNPCEAMEMERMMRDESFMYQSGDPPPADHNPHFH